MTTEQREEARQERLEELEAATASLMTTDGFQAWLKARHAFHTYSFNNQLLIAFQQPTRETEDGELVPTAERATRVAGYKAWGKLGRQVQKGSKGLGIFAPLMRKAKDDAGQPIKLASGKWKMEVYGFRIVRVFDVSQTEGEALPELETRSIAGESHEHLLAGLAGLAAELEVEVQSEDLSESGYGGYYDDARKLIMLDESVSIDEQVRTLTHELAHALGIGYGEYGRARAEAIVESATTVALGAFGFDTAGESLPYVAGWLAREDGGLETLRHDLGKIDEIAARLEEAAAAAVTEAVPA